jgi:hypothetical protein
VSAVTAATREYGSIVVCGGGCYGGYYVRQLARARAAGALRFEQIIVVDRDPYCAVARVSDAIASDDVARIREYAWQLARADGAALPSEVSVEEYRGLPISVRSEEWQPFFDAWLSVAIAHPESANRDAVVPSPLMPHLLADWVASRMRQRHPDARIARVPLASTPDTPWQRSAPDHAHYASFATWMCPINCIEPPRCPETKGPRDWTMPVAVHRAVGAAAAQGTPYDVVALFHTTHRAYGVGMFDVTDALETELRIAAASSSVALRVLVASVSHCHGALAELTRARAPEGQSVATTAP